MNLRGILARLREPKKGLWVYAEEADGSYSTVERFDAERRVDREYYPVGSLREETWWKGDVIHRDGGPAHLVHFEDGALAYAEWIVEGRRSRRDGPAETAWRPNGVLVYEEWYRDGLSERLGAPAYLAYGANGAATKVRWSVLGKHLPGPASIFEELSHADPAEAIEAIAWSTYRPLLREEVPLPDLIRALRWGVTTAEGLRALHEGSPLEWVRAFEAGAAS